LKTGQQNNRRACRRLLCLIYRIRLSTHPPPAESFTDVGIKYRKKNYQKYLNSAPVYFPAILICLQGISVTGKGMSFDIYLYLRRMRGTVTKL
jgi:hypothetical protein